MAEQRTCPMFSGALLQLLVVAWSRVLYGWQQPQVLAQHLNN